MERTGANPNTAKNDDEGDGQGRLPRSFVAQVFDRFRARVPDVWKSDVEHKERQLRATERRLQRRFIAEYRAQVKQIEPILFERGVGVGTSIRDALLGDRKKVDTKYEEVVTYRSAGLSLIDSPETREILKILDPMIAPILTPFVSGVERPLNESLSDIKATLSTYFLVSTAGAFVVGVAAGRWFEHRRR